MCLAEDAAVDGERFAEQLLRSNGIALGDQQERQVRLGGAGVRMVLAQHALGRRDVFAKERLGARQVTAVEQQQPQVVLAGRGFAMLFAENLSTNRQRLAARRLGFRSPSAISQHPRKLDERDRDILVLVAEQAPSRRQALDEQRLRRRRVAQLALEHTEIVQALRDADAVGPEHAPAERQRLLQQRKCLGWNTPAGIGPADDGEHLRLHVRLIAELSGNTTRAEIEQALDGGLTAGVLIRVGTQEQAGEQLAEFRCLLGLHPSTVAFGGEPHRIETDQAHEDRGRDCRCRQALPVPPNEFRGAVAHAVGPRRNRLVIDVSPQVVAELRHRGIAFRRILFQRLAEDGLQVAPQLALKPRRRRRAGRGQRRRRLGRGPDLNRIGQPHRLDFGHRLHVVRRRLRRRTGGMMAGQQLVQENAERVDVGRGGNGAAGDLLRRCVLWRHRRSRLVRQDGQRGLGVVLNQLGDAEVEQLDLSCRRHEDVRRLQVAVHDQVGVGVRDRRLDVEKEADARLDAEPLLVAEAIDVTAGDVFEHQVRLAGARDAGVDQPGDVRMGEAREEGAFALEALLAAAADQRGVQQLQRRLTLEAAVAS